MSISTKKFLDRIKLLHIGYYIKNPHILVCCIVRYYYYKIRFMECGWGCMVKSFKMITPNRIHLGRRVYIGLYSRIEGVTKYNDIRYNPKIIFHDCVSIQQCAHITCANHIEIGRNTSIAAGVTITDINHPYTDIKKPIERQDIDVKEVYIEEDCKIYNGVVILPGVHIGKHCVIGANSVVNVDIPDYSIAAGVPAKIIKRYNFQTLQWEPINYNN